MTPEQLELAISHYLDGTLPPEEIGELEQALAADADARELLQGHERLTALLRSDAAPEMDWADLARDFCAVVTGTVDEASRAQDQRLNVILKAAAPLPEMRWDEVARQISSTIDAEIDTAVAENDGLDELLQSAPMPAVNWDRLAGHLSHAVAAQADATDGRPAVIGRIGFARRIRPMAIAASMLLASGLGVAFLMNSRPTPTGPVAVNPVVQQATALVQLETPQIEAATQPAVAEVSIGPSKAYAANTGDDDGYRRGVASRSQLVIALPVGVDDDGEHALGFE